MISFSRVRRPAQFVVPVAPMRNMRISSDPLKLEVPNEVFELRWVTTNFWGKPKDIGPDRANVVWW